MIVLLIALTLGGQPPRHAYPATGNLPALRRELKQPDLRRAIPVADGLSLPIISVAKPYKQPKAQNARQRKLIEQGCMKVALHEWICPMPAPKRRHG